MHDVRVPDHLIKMTLLFLVWADGEEVDYCLVGTETEVFCEGQALGRDEDEQLNEVGFDDIGGCNRFVKKKTKLDT